MVGLAVPYELLMLLFVAMGARIRLPLSFSVSLIAGVGRFCKCALTVVVAKSEDP